MNNRFLTKGIDFFNSHRLLWVFLWLLSVLSLADIPTSPVFRLSTACQIIYLVFVSAFKSSLLLILLSPLLYKKRLHALAWVCVVIYAVMAITNAFCHAYYGMGISRKLILVFAQTTPDEAAGFMPGLLHNLTGIFRNGLFYLSAGIAAGMFLLIKRIGRKAFAWFCSVVSLAGFCCFVIFSISHSSGRSAHSLVARTVKYSMEVYRWNKSYQDIMKLKKPLPHIESVESDRLCNTAIVVIGESALRSHHSLYGYKLPTTPQADDMADSLYVFTDAIGSSKSTSGNMERILSFKEDDQTYGDGLDYPLLIDFFKEAGYKTFWLSNQERTGSVSNTSGVMVMNSDVTDYVGADNSEDALCFKYDEALLPALDKALSDSASHKLIFIHLLGSHVEFNQRYPEEYNFFTYGDELKAFGFDWLDKDMAQRRAEYDNSIRYTDHLLSEIINRTAYSDKPSVTVYFSDHGENVYDDSSYTGRDDKCAEVPFYIYLNRQYTDRNQHTAQQLTKAVDKPFSTANFVYMLMTLTGSRYALYNPQLDVLSDSYTARPRYVDEQVWPEDL